MSPATATTPTDSAPLPEPPSEVSGIVFLGSPDEAVPALRALVDAGHRIDLVISAPDRRRSRRGSPTPTPVKAAALQLGLPVSDDLADVGAAVDAGANLGVVVAYGRIIRRPLLERLAMVNLHFSLLPRWRGAAPVERAVLAGDDRTGVAVMGVEEGLDTGPVYAEVEVPIGPTDTVAGLRSDLSRLGADLLVEALAAGLGSPRPQQGEVTYARKITPDDLELRFAEEPAEQLGRRVRVGGAWTSLRGDRLKVWTAEPIPPGADVPPPGELSDGVVGTASGGLRLIEVHLAGRARQDAEEFLRGLRPEPGERLGV
ncbi:MAG: methionyl-tRNA formyltransferase [Microthrixaceae bacterium]